MFQSQWKTEEDLIKFVRLQMRIENPMYKRSLRSLITCRKRKKAAKFIIRSVSNGYILKDDSSGEEIVGVIGADSDEKDNFADFLCAIERLYGPSDSRYDKKRIYINVFPGDKCEELPRECPLCWQKIPHPAE